jgi:hydrogenase expression/formation protein HypC
MCLAIPVRVAALFDDQQAEVEVGGVRNRISLAFLDGVAVGDFVIVHAGFAIARLDVAEAEKTLALFEQIAAYIGASSDALYPRFS